MRQERVNFHDTCSAHDSCMYVFNDYTRGSGKKSRSTMYTDTYVRSTDHITICFHRQLYTYTILLVYQCELSIAGIVIDSKPSTVYAHT